MSKKTIEVHECDFCHTLEINADEVADSWVTVNQDMIACDRCRSIISHLAVTCKIPHDGTYHPPHLTINMHTVLTSQKMIEGVIETLVFLGIIRPVKKERY